MTSRTETAPSGFTAAAFWVRAPGQGDIRPVALPEPGPGEVLVRTVHSGVSRGTETLVFRGGVPKSQWEEMRAPFQDGSFPGPVKYGYLSVGVVERGPDDLSDLVGRTVFCLHPHQTAYVVPASAVVPVPDDVPARRAVLAGTVETAQATGPPLVPTPKADLSRQSRLHCLRGPCSFFRASYWPLESKPLL